jgi:hypothetical protein
MHFSCRYLFTMMYTRKYCFVVKKQTIKKIIQSESDRSKLDVTRGRRGTVIITICPPFTRDNTYIIYYINILYTRVPLKLRRSRNNARVSLGIS